MGAWGHRNFESDQAWDFADEFINKPSEASLRGALTTVLALADAGDYLEVDEASAALVAAEVIATTLNKPATDFPEELQEVTSQLRLKQAAQLKSLAQQAVNIILSASELQELWAENGEPNEWQVTQQDLLRRLA